MNLILISIPNGIYNSVDSCQTAREMWLRQYERLVIASRAKKLEKTHDPLVLVAHTSSSSSRSPSAYYVTHPPFVRYSTPINNRLRSSSNTRNQAVVQADRVNIQSKNVGNDGRIARRSYNTQEESAEGSNVQKETGNVQRTLRTSSAGNVTNVQCYNCNAKGHYAQECPKPRVRDSKYFMEQMFLAKKDEAEVILSNEQNDFLIADVAQWKRLRKLSANICTMARIQPTNIDSDERPCYDSTFISEVQTPSTSFMNLLFSYRNHQQTYHEQPQIINSPIDDDQINSDIIFDDPNVDINDESIEHDKNANDSHDNELEQLARNAYKEVEKQQILAKRVKQQNIELTKQLEQYKEQVRVFETTNMNKTNFHKEYIEADHWAKQLAIDLQNQFIQDRDKIRALEKERDALQLSVSEQNKHVVELKARHTSLKHKLNAAEDKYLDDVLNLEAKLKKNENVVMKMSNSVQALFMLGPKQSSVYDQKLKHGLGYENPYTLKQAISQNPKLYDASYLHSSKVHVKVCDTEEILKDATKSQNKMENKLKDLIAIEKKQIFVQLIIRD
ncbi:retrovirus-related pol polyprotein from transposon TNT 1-94 [Tanacetum coccineum]